MSDDARESATPRGDLSRDPPAPPGYPLPLSVDDGERSQYPELVGDEPGPPTLAVTQSHPDLDLDATLQPLHADPGAGGPHYVRAPRGHTGHPADRTRLAIPIDIR
ncbi:hypothetical protein GCM10012285_03500 [Streptomyces kronopolitis]|uniref:Uncharacterized protein n=1 Tax=Streptomyces kronopolitis TaxID=1612435 RepID=A0ABQ2IZM7_9ACTN|nr:hypothetical protein GCM10012285_03500 [Streptomyces kronopolitis]